MADLPVVSVVIPCHDHGRYLREAVESVQRQTFKELEIIVVDDGSTDDTPTVAAALPGIRHIRQEHRGLSAARNAGWRASRGRYLTFLDADDRLLPHAVQVGVDHVAAHPDAAFVSGHYAMIDATGMRTGTGTLTCVSSGHYRALLRSNYVGMHATVMYRREAFDRFGGFDPRLRACEDYDLFLRMARQAPTVCHPEIVAEYRRHGSNMSRDHALMLHSALTVLRRQRRYVRRQGPDGEAYREGARFWRRLFGEPLLDDARGRMETGEAWGPTVRMLLILARHHPSGLARRTMGLARRLGRQALDR